MATQSTETTGSFSLKYLLRYYMADGYSEFKGHPEASLGNLKLLRYRVADGYSESRGYRKLLLEI